MASILKIGERLSKIVELCPNAKVIADIGCDHGYVAAELVLENKAKRVIATEKSEKCLMKAVELASEINITPFVSFRVGNGFDAITKHDHINFAVIAGMGGLEIIEILKNRPKKLNNFILQPMNHAIELRRFLIKNDLKIDYDKKTIENGKYYDIIKVKPGYNDLAEIEIFFGRTNFKGKDTTEFYGYLLERHIELLKLSEDNDGLSDKTQKELEFVEQAIALFDEANQEKAAKEGIDLLKNYNSESEDEKIEEEDIKAEKDADVQPSGVDENNHIGEIDG